MKNTRELWSLKIANYIAENTCDWTDKQYEKLFNNISYHLKQDNTTVNPVDFLYSEKSCLNTLAEKILNIDHTRVVDFSGSNEIIVKEICGVEDYEKLENKKAEIIKEYNKKAEENGWDVIYLKNTISKLDHIEDDLIAVENKLGVNHWNSNQKIDHETGLDQRQTLIRKKCLEAGAEDPFADKIAKWRENIK